MLSLTENAVKKLQQLFATDPSSKGKFFRISVKAGGCSGYEYDMAFDEKRPEDTEVMADGVRVLVGLNSAKFLANSKVDYVESLTTAGFKILNPNAKGSCGCGQSVSFDL